MGRILAIDYGRKNCGIAVTDPLRLSVNPRPVVAEADLLPAVETLLAEGDVDTVVLTHSRRIDGTANPIERRIARFAERLRAAAPGVEIDYEDEAGTSVEARRHLIATGVGRKRRSAKGALDSVSAGIILERYLRRTGIW